MGFRFSLRWCSTGGGPRGRCPPSWAGTRFFFGAAPLQEQVVRLGSSLLPMGGPTRPTPGVPFVSRRKEPKACRGCAPGPPLGGIIIPPAARACMRLLLPPERVCATNPDRFATLSLWANRSFFLPEIGRSHTFFYQTVARQRGPISGQLQRKQRKHRTFLTLFLYTILKYLFIKILCFRCSWPINGVIKPFVAAQKLHKTCTNCTVADPLTICAPNHAAAHSLQKSLAA